MEAELIAAIVAAPDDVAAKEVYADWLEQRGDPRAELVRIEAHVWDEPIDLVRYRTRALRRDVLRATCDPQWCVQIARPSAAAIRRRVAVLDGLDPERKIFSADSHGYVLNPALGEDEVRAIEAAIGHRLPDQYRWFVGEVADGGAGPDYGLRPIAGATEPMSDFVPPTNAPDEEFEPRGAIELVEIGCGNYYYLVIAGPLAGQVWLRGDAGWSPVPIGAWGSIGEMCALPASARAGLVDWYAAWLDDSLGRIARMTPDDDTVFALPVDQAIDINLRGRALTAVPDGLRRLTAVERVDLGKNPLVELPDWIGELTSLGRLALDYTALRRLPDAIVQLRALRSLSCFHGEVLEVLPDELGRLVELRGLDLRYNAIARLPDSIGDLVHLEALEVCNNRLTTVPASVARLKLTKLDLSFNQLVELPDELGALPITEVNLRGNKDLVTLPPCLARMPIETITLGDNPRLDLAAACRLLEPVATLRHLSFGSSQLDALPDDIGRLTQLTSIYLGWNNLATLPETLANLTRLRHLDLRGNGPRGADQATAMETLLARAYALLPDLNADS